jgi:predicted transcriptional regulator YdeE
MISTLISEDIKTKTLNFSQLDKMADASLYLSTKIESALFVEMNEEISKDYGKKFRDLLAALKNDENTELREGLVTGKIKPADFVKFERNQLIPKSLILQRE